MSEAPNIGGPSHKTLSLLRDLLPSFKKGIKDGTLRGKGKPGMVSRPRKMCRVCGKLWDNVMVRAGSNHPVMADLCADCDARLKAGDIAITWRDKYMFAASKGALEDFRGSVLHVSDETWQALEFEYKDQVKTKTKEESPKDEPKQPAGNAN